ncbi:GAF domain-containing protein [Cyanobium sp. Morenito 9A2]|uniref:sensor domain-containing diguanylate cyclase n=1 Tax=Cyanobium sp. Morenito 9A2 TaxID=2823718 RepID=UPI0020CC57E4|nr:GAF domain-containing protein [Cyanobium sp. Morenito 9A2]MCP9849419.1 diguanylate cyclase [Cyanobium sp. Morenito 9A2]
MPPYPDYPLPVGEEDRLRSLERSLLLDGTSDPNLDRIVKLAAEIIQTPIALISLVDRNRQWFLSRVGLEATETPREMAFCAHAICGDGVMVVPDAAADDRFATNPLVTGEPKIRFYAGVPLRTAVGQHLGTLCVIDRTPHQLESQQHRVLEMLAQQVIRELELRQEAACDVQTGLFNRASFQLLAQKELERARRTDQSLSLLTLLIDPPAHSPFVDLAGIERAELLREIAACCGAASGKADLLGRLGPLEFGLTLVNSTADQARQVAETLLSQLVPIGAGSEGTRPPTRLRIGVSQLRPTDQSFSDLLIRTDNALCLARANGVEVL